MVLWKNSLLYYYLFDECSGFYGFGHGGGEAPVLTMVV